MNELRAATSIWDDVPATNVGKLVFPRVLMNHTFTWVPFFSSVDNSEYMRNGDFLPTRLQAQQDAVNIVCHSKTRSNPENNVGLITMAK